MPELGKNHVGVFSRQVIKKGSIVIDYPGELLTAKHAKKIAKQQKSETYMLYFNGEKLW